MKTKKKAFELTNSNGFDRIPLGRKWIFKLNNLYLYITCMAYFLVELNFQQKNLKIVQEFDKGAL